MKKSLLMYLKFFLASSFLTSATAFAHSDIMAGETDEDAHIRFQEEAHAREYAYRLEIQQKIENGIPFDVASGQCKYISTIFQQPPAKKVVLTFDDGPSAQNTGRVLDILRRYNIKATFFLLGKQVQAYPQLVGRMVREGHLVGNHSWSHPAFPTLPPEQQKQQVVSSDKYIAPYMAAQGMKIFRYPYGSASCYSNQLIQSMGYFGILGWHVDTCDWAYARTGTVTSQSAIQSCGVAASDVSSYQAHVMRSVHRHNGGVILMHDIHKNTVDNLEGIIQTLLREGYQFTNMNTPEMKAYFANRKQ